MLIYFLIVNIIKNSLNKILFMTTLVRHRALRIEKSSVALMTPLHNRKKKLIESFLFIVPVMPLPFYMSSERVKTHKDIDPCRSVHCQLGRGWAWNIIGIKNK